MTPMTPMPSFDDPIRLHAAYLYETVLKIPYPGQTSSLRTGDIPRPLHGIAHACRVAIYIPILLNLYQRYQYPAALNITERQLQLLQITALLHDAMREDDGDDHWDLDSARYCFTYMLNIGATREEAIQMAEVIANKDGEGYRFREIWEKVGGFNKTILQKLLHDADCLDVIRVRQKFLVKNLDFFLDIACQNPRALRELAEIVIEVRRLIFLMGNGMFLFSKNIAESFSTAQCYDLILPLFKDLPLLSRLRQPEPVPVELPLVDIKPFDSNLDHLEPHNLERALKTGKIFARGIISPLLCRPSKGQKPPETSVSIEVRKQLRRPEIPTATTKGNALGKFGNPRRSISQLGFGSGTFADVGFLLIDPTLTGVKSINHETSLSGVGKKTHLTQPDLTPLEVQTGLGELLIHQKLVFNENTLGSYNEIVCTLTQVDAVYYDLLGFSHSRFSKFRVFLGGTQSHFNASVIKAKFVADEYQRITGKRLPVISYSRMEDKLTVAHMTKDFLKLVWEGMLKEQFSLHVDYAKLSIAHECVFVFKLDLERLKKVLIYNSQDDDVAHIVSPDIHYDEELKQFVNERILFYRENYRAKFVIKLLDELSATQNRWKYITAAEGVKSVVEIMTESEKDKFCEILSHTPVDADQAISKMKALKECYEACGRWAQTADGETRFCEKISIGPGAYIRM